MTGRTFHIGVLTLAALAGVSAPAFAQSKAERYRKSIDKLFSDAVAPIADSTVKVRMDGKDVVLGTVVEKGGYILTKASELGKDPISVRFRDGSEYDAKYVGYSRDTDLALLKIDADPPPVTFATVKDDNEVGNWVAVVGPESDAIAVGILSVGPRKLYREEALIENVNKGYMGVILSEQEVKGGGVRIASFGTSMASEANSAAKKAHLKAGDVIIKVNGKAVDNRDKLFAVMDGFKPNDTVTVTVRRKVTEKQDDEEKTVDKVMDFKLKLGGRSEPDRSDMQNRMGSILSGRKTGFPMVIQHDTVLKPSECGGPLIDLDGKVLGINIARAGRVESWALPPQVITPVIKELKTGKFPPPVDKK
ncbi:MAG TPA: trypsin-like peptidase domain-containing protein [Fimbriiglobus sp.]|jgi:serine protease Do